MKLTPPLCSLSLLGACVANATKALMCWQDVIDANHTPTPLLSRHCPLLLQRHSVMCLLRCGLAFFILFF